MNPRKIKIAGGDGCDDDDDDDDLIFSVFKHKPPTCFINKKGKINTGKKKKAKVMIDERNVNDEISIEYEGK